MSKSRIRKSLSLEDFGEVFEPPPAQKKSNLSSSFKFQKDPRDSYKVHIEGSKIIKDSNGKKFTTYSITVQNLYGVKWEIHRRYSEFRTLMNTLKGNYKNIPKGFPPKKIVGNLTSAVIDKRKVSLQDWIDKVLISTDIPIRPEIFSFLEDNKITILSQGTVVEEEYESEESESEEEEDEEIDERPKRSTLVDIEDEDDILHKTYLYKLYFNQWKKRYFVLLKNGKLYKYRSHRERRSCGRYAISKTMRAQEITIDVGNRKDSSIFQFVVITSKNKTFIFATKTEKERQKWVNMINDHIIIKSTFSNLLGTSINNDNNPKDDIGLPLFFSSLVNYIMEMIADEAMMISTSSGSDGGGSNGELLENYDSYFRSKFNKLITKDVIKKIQDRSFNCKEFVNIMIAFGLVYKYLESLPDVLLTLGDIESDDYRKLRYEDLNIETEEKEYKALKDSIIVSILSALTSYQYNVVFRVVTMINNIVIRCSHNQLTVLEDYASLFSAVLFKEINNETTVSSATDQTDCNDDSISPIRKLKIQTHLLIHLIYYSSELLCEARNDDKKSSPSSPPSTLQPQNKENDNETKSTQSSKPPPPILISQIKKYNRNTVHYKPREYRTMSPRRPLPPQNTQHQPVTSSSSFDDVDSLFFQKTIKSLRKQLASSDYNDIQKLAVEDQLLSVQIDFENHKCDREKSKLKDINSQLDNFLLNSKKLKPTSTIRPNNTPRFSSQYRKSMVKKKPLPSSKLQDVTSDSQTSITQNTAANNNNNTNITSTGSGPPNIGITSPRMMSANFNLEQLRRHSSPSKDIKKMMQERPTNAPSSSSSSHHSGLVKGSSSLSIEVIQPTNNNRTKPDHEGREDVEEITQPEELNPPQLEGSLLQIKRSEYENSARRYSSVASLSPEDQLMCNMSLLLFVAYPKDHQ